MTFIRSVLKKIFFPVAWWFMKNVIRMSYRLKVASFGIAVRGMAAGPFKAEINYVPNRLGRFLRLPLVRQGYMKTQDGWTAYPHGTCWGVRYCEVPARIQRILDALYRKHNLDEVIEMNERRHCI